MKTERQKDGRGRAVRSNGVVTPDVPEAVLAAGNPCGVIRQITE